MERNKMHPPITLFIVFLLLTGMAKLGESQFRGPPMPSRPLCLSQFALANHACSLLPYGPNPYEPPPPSDDPDDPDEVLHLDSDHQDSEHHAGNPGHGNGNGNGGDHDHNHDHDHGNGRGRHHAHRHRLSSEERRRRHRHHRHHETPIEEDCCRWLRAVDDQCVCEVLVHLPVFLARPWHRYQVVVDSTCNVTYDCAGRVIGL